MVPELLGENQPDIRALLEESGIGFRFQYEVLPEGLLPRFIVQTNAHSEANPAWRWRTGVVLQRDGCQAVIRADARERRVDIHITGNPTMRRGLLAIIRERFEEQHRDLKGLVVDERVPVPGDQDITVSYRDLLKRESRDEMTFYPENADRPISVQALLSGVESRQERIQRRNREGGLRHSTVEPTGKVFISYSHKDARFLDELLVHLRPLERRGLVAKWSDREIAPGSQWFDEIHKALSSAKVAVLLVSPAFLDSDFIYENELGPLLKQADVGGVRILWVPLRACGYKQTLLKDYHPVLPPDTPLAQMKAERDAAWVKVCEEIEKALSI